MEAPCLEGFVQPVAGGGGCGFGQRGDFRAPGLVGPRVTKMGGWLSSIETLLGERELKTRCREHKSLSCVLNGAFTLGWKVTLVRTGMDEFSSVAVVH